MSDRDGETWDVFISHASEDKLAIAEPLRRGVESKGAQGLAGQSRVARNVHAGVQQAVEAAIIAVEPSSEVRVVHSSDFHDRFWIADRKRGVIVGTSLNKIGRKVFFVDALSTSDTTDVVAEVERPGV